MHATAEISPVKSIENNTVKIHCLAISLTVLATRVAYLLSPAGRVGDADEAVFGMMAQKILSGEEFPIFCWEAQYAGAPVSYLAAIIFHFIGADFVSLRLAMLPAAMLTPLLFYFIYSKLFPPREAIAGAMLLIFCPFFVLKYTMAGIGGYGETFLATAIIILLAWRLPDVSEGRRLFFACFVLGLVSGFSFYILFLVLPGILAFVLPAVWREPHKRWWRLASFCLGGLLGASPMIFYNLTSGGGTFLRAAGRSMAVGREAVQTPLAELMRQIFFNKLAYLKAWFLAATGMFGEYVMPEVMGDPILTVAGLLLVFALAWFVIHAIGSRLSPDRVASKRLGEFAVFIVFLMLFQWIGNLNRARHFMPLILALPVVLFAVNLRQGGGKRRAIALWLIVGAVSLLQAGAWLVKFQAAHFSPAPVAAAMRSAGITHFYGSYGTVYPIMFADNRNLRGSPKFVAGNKGILSDRRPDYTREVEQAMFPAFVFADNEKELRDRLLAFLEASGAEATVMTIDGTDVVFNLSVPIHAVFAPDRGTTFALGKHQ